ncbi:OLC1v1031839C1 [Oldenlandia corymbosa var. corymbosa]|uniref:OLC1v1031839C1 n=1 Tax=Oldenlandia corymbosa var. corymbosa TaxID=529605 RepID=A0AAV1CMN3_OLDCO|nr:OLC1v1031839C1 [Oldenlandia corymbosa var. corymbosa]
MNPLQDTWSSFSPDSFLEDDLMNSIQPDLEMNQNYSIDQPTNQYPSFPNPPEMPSSAEAPFKVTLTFTKSGNQKTILFGKPTSPTSSAPSPFISFGSLNGMAKNSTNVIKKESAETICFKKMDSSGSSSCSSSSFSEEKQQYWDVDHDDDDDDQFLGALSDKPMSVQRNTRTPLQAKSHVVAERKRREKLLKRFKDLSDLIPGLKKLDKISIINGAINILKGYEDQIKALQEELDEERRKRESVQDDAHEEKPTVCCDDDDDVEADYPK